MSKLVEIRYINTKKGRGVFAKRRIREGMMIDNAQIILIPFPDYDMLDKTILGNYCHVWDDPDREPGFDAALCMSFCEFMNHSYDPNVRYQYDYDTQTIEWIAIKDIEKGQELKVNYNGEVDDKSPVWFDIED